MCFPGRMLQISWTAKKFNEAILREADTMRSPINRLHKCQASSFGRVTIREELEHLE